MFRSLVSLVAVGAASIGLATDASARDQIKIVGSSTVYPFSSYVGEEFGSTTRYPVPVIESTGSGGGHKLFGAGIGTDHPDITNSSRRIKTSEFGTAANAGITITEAVIGYDGIAFAEGTGGETLDFTLEQIFLAVAAEVPDGQGGLKKNDYKNWSDIDAALPDRPIVIYGPPTTSGTRDAFEELVMEAASEELDGYGGEGYTDVRQDGVYVDSGENDNLIVQKLQNDKNAFGIFGYGFLEENRDKVQGASIGGVAPSPESISSGDYPVSRSLYFYIKNEHVGVVPGLMQFVDLFMSEEMIGPNGQLKEIGLVPLPSHLREASRQRVLNLIPMEMKGDTLKSLQEYASENGFSQTAAAE
jgi:phosphate transport system substrate-binding protein